MALKTSKCHRINEFDLAGDNSPLSFPSCAPPKRIKIKIWSLYKSGLAVTRDKKKSIHHITARYAVRACPRQMLTQIFTSLRSVKTSHIGNVMRFTLYEAVFYAKLSHFIGFVSR